jgi:hypothetical protein
MSPAYINLGWLARSQLVSLTEQLSALSSQLSALSLKFQMLKVLLLVKIRGPNASKCGMRKKDFLGGERVYATAAAAAYFGAWHTIFPGPCVVACSSA